MKVFLSFALLFLLMAGTGLKAEEYSIDDLIEQAEIQREEGKVLLNFENIDLKLLTYFISELTGKNIVIGTDLKGTATLVFSEPVSIDEAWEIYTTILKTRNYAVVDRGEFVEIVGFSGTRNTVPPVNQYAPPSDEMITYVYKLKNADITQVANILAGLKSAKGKIFTYNPAGVVIITDTASNIANLKKILSIIDTETSKAGIRVYKLKFVRSSELSSAVSGIFSDYAKKGVGIKSFNINSLNAFVVKAPPEVLEKIDRLVQELDVPSTDLNYRKFWIIKLKNAKAKDIATVLNQLLENVSQIAVSPEQGKQTGKEGKTEGGKGKQLKTVSQLIGGSYARRDRPKVIADETSNSLVIYANPVEFRALKELIENLDREKKQILITAFITEVSQSALQEIGVRWQIFGTQGGAAFRGGLSESSFYSLFGQSNFVAGVLSTSGKNLNINGTTLFFPELLFMFSLLERGSGFNVVSSPKILVMDNRPAKINVSQVVPYAQSVKYDVNGNPIVNYDYKEVGLILEVTPHISGKNVILELHQEVNDIIGFESAQVGNLSYIVPRTSKREIDTIITVENAKTVVLGGLISKKTVKTMEGVPLFSKLPVVGNLFKYRSDSNDKTNLFVFITPFIINKPEDLARITQEHMELVNKLQQLKKKEKTKKTLPEEKEKDIFEEYREYFGG
ncbi:MAG: type II secretion system secretin GspD [Aquificae bacterium]|nr:type II secretion system secretin GspD [Aquificota bacterium]